MRILFLLALLSSSLTAAPLGITLTTPAPDSPAITMGTAVRQDGTVIGVDRFSLRRNNQPWTPVMGEFHFSRYPESEWKTELLKMKAGGVDIVASYVFWIHHEEIQGEWNWSGQRDLRRFVSTAKEVGLDVIVRCGPWCHGEVRNGGFPDWIAALQHTRSDDPTYLSHVEKLYAQIAGQLRGLLWKDGGPVIGIQLENEYGGPAEHLLTLKKIARTAGLDVPIYTRTGWPKLKTPMPFGEIIPLYGVYAEGFWDREITPMPGQYWAGFHFSTLRTDANIATDALGHREVKDRDDANRYPYLTCEIGGGMMSSYHRRIFVYPDDVEATTLVKLGSGSVSPGYYMYHGGTNPEGRLTTLMETQATATTNWNDLPVKNYDFQTALGQYGQIRPQYHLLRRLHLFLHNFGQQLARTAVALPDQRPSGKGDIGTLRWSARSDGRSGFIFVNNYERLRTLPAKPDTQFAVALADGTKITFPSKPVTVPAGARFIWPVNLDLGDGVTLAFASAQPLCVEDEGTTRTVFFAETPGIPAEFSIAGETDVRAVTPGRSPQIEITGKTGGKVRIVLLSENDSLALWQQPWAGRSRVFLTHAGLVVDGDKVILTSEQTGDLKLAVFPADKPATDGIFQQLAVPVATATSLDIAVEVVRKQGALRKIVPAKTPQPVAAAPEDADFEHAAVWKIALPASLDLGSDPLLRIHYTGDVARVSIAGKFINDDFYNGRALEIGLRRYAALLKEGPVEIAILPLQKNVPILLPREAQPNFDGHESLATIRRIELVPRVSVTVLPSHP